ncbi:MAG TPA: sigma-70 family RNA polymerase sigma factor [Polyangia bacterium]|nr:sigma-70 family RNA polymerase sigma factor [Polyangia bacterium]
MPTPVLHVVPGSSASAAAADSRAALRELYTRYGGSVYGRCEYLLRDRAKAEDAMQDVFAKALVSLSAFRAESSPLTWLMKIATHHCLNILRAERAPWHKRFRREEEARPVGDGGGPQLVEDREAVRKLLGKLDAETAAAAVHYHVDEMTLEEIAALLGRSVPTIRKRLETFAAISGQEIRR